MAEQTAEQEPTMEEILASIRRIISEDDEAAPEAQSDEPVFAEEDPAPAPPEPEDEPVSFDAPEPAPEPDPEPEPAAETDEDVFELTDRVDETDDEVAFEDPEPEPEMATEPAAAIEDDELVSEPVATAAASAFGDLVGQMLVSSRSTEGKTLEDIVRELVKPMLREWLDSNLRQIVEASVQAEVEKIAARGRR